MRPKNIKVEDFKIICRICLKISENRVNLFSKLDSLVKESVIAAAVMDCSSIQVQIEDKLPKLICQECIQLLDIAYRFRWLCAQSDVTLRQILSGYENNIKQENIDDDGLDSNTDRSVYPSNSPNTNIINELKFCDNSEKAVEDKKITIDPLSNSVDSTKISSDNCKYSVEALKCLKYSEKAVGNKKVAIDPLSNSVHTTEISSDNSIYSVEALKCLKCLRVFKRKYHFQKHLKLCLADFERERIAKMKEGNLTTASDGKLVKTSYIIAEDSIQESGNDQYTYGFSHCDKKFATTDTLQQHTKNLHTDERNNIAHQMVNNRFNCEFCGRFFKRNAMLIIHLRSHTGIRPFKCEICERTFTESAALRIHSRRHLDLSRKEKTSNKDHLCSECGKYFYNKENLLLHSSVHTGIKPFNCDICNRYFARVSSLNRHLLQHTGVKPYSCQICEKKFTQSGNLNNHLTKHHGLKPFFCKFCEKYFSEKGNLKMHMRIHTGEKPYVCAICEKAFYDSRGVEKHKRIHRIESPDSINN